MTNPNIIEIIGVDEATGDLYHEEMTCSGIITVSGTAPFLYYVCASGHYEP